jgi:alpha-L-fucosidase
MDNDKTKWFSDAKLGLFIHWGLYSILAGRWKGKTMPGIGEWIQSYYRIPNAEYSRLAEQFNPVDFDADEWMAKAENAGCKYMVFTAKHHDGFAMYRTEYNTYNVVDATPFGRDPLEELVEACRKHNIVPCIYYSQALDWNERDGADPGPDVPLNDYVMPWGNSWDFTDHKAKDFSRYFESKVLFQLKELLTNYGEIGLVWFDCPRVISPEQSKALKNYVKSLQPNCIVNSRIGNGYGDYLSLGDNEAPKEKSISVAESPVTMNRTWAYKVDDNDWKKTEDVIQKLIDCSGKNSNLLLNVGPKPNGSFTPETDTILEGVGEWMRNNKQAL